MRRSKLGRASIAQRLMRPASVVPGEPTPESLLGLRKILKLMLPHAFLFETAEEPFDDAILFRCVRRDEFLRKPIIATGSPEPAALKDQPIVTTHNWHRALGPQCAEPLEAGRLERPFGLLGSAAQGEFIANHFTIMTIDHRSEMRPAIGATGNVSHIHRPPLITGCSLTPPAPHSGPRGARPLMHQPAFELEDPIDHFAIDLKPVSIPQQGPQPPIAKRRMLRQELMESRRQRRREPRGWRLAARLAMQRCAGHLQDPAASAFRDTRDCLPHSSDVPRAKGYVYGPIPFAKTVFTWWPKTRLRTYIRPLSGALSRPWP